MRLSNSESHLDTQGTSAPSVANDPSVNHLPFSTTLGPSVQDQNCVPENPDLAARLSPRRQWPRSLRRTPDAAPETRAKEKADVSSPCSRKKGRPVAGGPPLRSASSANRSPSVAMPISRRGNPQYSSHLQEKVEVDRRSWPASCARGTIGQEASMTTQPFALAERDEVLCDAPCYNTNVFAPGAYKIRCDQCSGRRGHYDRDNQWIECSNCLGTGNVRCPTCHGSGKIIPAD